MLLFTTPHHYLTFSLSGVFCETVGSRVPDEDDDDVETEDDFSPTMSTSDRTSLSPSPSPSPSPLPLPGSYSRFSPIDQPSADSSPISPISPPAVSPNTHINTDTDIALMPKTDFSATRGTLRDIWISAAVMHLLFALAIVIISALNFDLIMEQVLHPPPLLSPHLCSFPLNCCIFLKTFVLFLLAFQKTIYLLSDASLLHTTSPRLVSSPLASSVLSYK